MGLSVTTITTKKDLRLDQARAWLEELGLDLQSNFQDIAGDASFRRYFRLQINGESRVLMDSPPPGQNVRPFMDIAQRLRDVLVLGARIVVHRIILPEFDPVQPFRQASGRSAATRRARPARSVDSATDSMSL